MYKVFVNKTPIVLTDNMENFDSEKWTIVSYQNREQLVDLVVEIEKGHYKLPTVIFHFDLDELWSTFIRQFKYVQASGGMVFNAKNEFLVIKRNGKWDLPKGHLKKGERPEFGGMREVEEECGIQGLSITQHLANTYHMYERNGLVLKKTFWYVMRSDFKGQLVPQIEEGIEKVVWRTKEDIEEMMKKSYPIIRELLEKGVSLISR